MKSVRMKLFLSFVGLSLFFPTVGFSQKEEMAIPDYITKYSALAQQEMRRTGIPASIKLAQGILESRFGNSKLATKANNHFGIKCGGNWEGPTFTQDDDTEKECFRKYESVYHSYRDHSNFLIGRERYDALFKLDPKDYKGWANGLQKAGYATNPNYSTLLIRLIEERNLHVYDNQSKHQPLTPEEEEYLRSMDKKFFVFNGIKTVVSQPNEMAMDIATKYDISLGQLLNFNDLSEGDYIPPGSKIYLQPKKTKGYEIYHRVKEGETMHYISQVEGMKLKSLYKKNRMVWGQEPAVGEVLCLRKKCDTAPKMKTDEDIKKDIQQDIQKRVDEAVKEKQEVEINQQESVAETVQAPDEAEPKDAAPPVEAVVVQDKQAESPGTIAESPGTIAPSPAAPKYHIVAPQETIYRISSIYKVSAADLRKWNGLASNTLTVGQSLIVSQPAAGTAEVGEAKKTGAAEEKTTDNSIAEKPVPAAQPAKKYHTVAPKETLYRISTLYGVTVEELKKWNNLNSSEISIGQQLIVGQEAKPLTKQEQAPEPVIEEEMKEDSGEKTVPVEANGPPSGLPTYHRVQQGETLYSVSQRYGLNVEELKKLNSLTSTDIRPGQVLKLQ